MTDELLIKWWEDEIHLAEYVDSDYRDGIKVDYIKYTLDLINRQKAEIERLEKILDKRCDVCPAVTTAIKEFADKLKEYFPSIADAIDYTAQEVVGEQK